MPQSWNKAEIIEYITLSKERVLGGNSLILDFYKATSA